MKNVIGKNEYAEVQYDLPGSQPSNGRIYKHRLIAQRMLGRVLKPGECVVRKDGDRSNSNPENIMVFKTKGGALRYNSSNRDEFLFKRPDGVYDYDWETIEKIKSLKAHHCISPEKVDEVLDFIDSHQGLTMKELEQSLNIPYYKIYRIVNKHGVISKCKVNINENKILYMPRNEIIKKIENCSNIKDIMVVLNMPENKILSSFPRRGLSTVGKHKKFKYLDKEILESCLNNGMSMQRIARYLGTFEENAMVEVKRLGIENNVYSFVNNDSYVMPIADDYEPEVVEEIQEILEPEQETIGCNEIDLSDIPFNEPNEPEQVSFKSVMETVYKYDISLSDLQFLTRKTIRELSSGADIKAEDIEQLKFIKNVLSKENIFMLKSLGFSNSKIAEMYDFSVDMVRHVVEHA